MQNWLSPLLGALNLYRKLSNKHTSPNKRTPLFFQPLSRPFFTFFTLTQSKIVRFPFRKKPLEADLAFYNMNDPLKACFSTQCVYWRIYGILLLSCNLHVHFLELALSFLRHRLDIVDHHNSSYACKHHYAWISFQTLKKNWYADFITVGRHININGFHFK